jgi:hypothetical protein
MFHRKHILFLYILYNYKKNNITFIQCLLTHYIFERWGNTHTHTHTHTHIPKKPC